jgi:hypothetical protein
MGHSTYSCDDRLARSADLGYHTKSVADIFTQQKERKIHDSMSPRNIDKRECRDSEAHPNTVPIILQLDLTGSMGSIPHDLIKDGLPTLMGDLVQNGVPDASLLFLGVGDHECDSYPLQVGQFESGDAELDMWLTRTYIEGGGGGNAGESYLLSWYFAANHTVTDSFEKRNKKGFLFTIGDEPCLNNLPKSAKTEIMGDTARGQVTTAEELLKESQKTYNVYHLHVLQGSAGIRSLNYWKELLGQNCIEISDYREIAKTVAKIVKDNVDSSVKVPNKRKENKKEEATTSELAEML